MGGTTSRGVGRADRCSPPAIRRCHAQAVDIKTARQGSSLRLKGTPVLLSLFKWRRARTDFETRRKCGLGERERNEDSRKREWRHVPEARLGRRHIRDPGPSRLRSGATRQLLRVIVEGWMASETRFRYSRLAFRRARAFCHGPGWEYLFALSQPEARCVPMSQR